MCAGPYGQSSGRRDRGRTAVESTDWTGLARGRHGRTAWRTAQLFRDDIRRNEVVATYESHKQEDVCAAPALTACIARCTAFLYNALSH